MEKHFMQLVDRTRSVRADAGRPGLLRGVSRGPDLRDAVETRVRSLRMEITGTVRVAAIYSVGLHDMSRCMKEFMRQYPAAKVQLEYLRPNKVLDAVLNSEVDLGLMSYPMSMAELSVIPLRSEAMVLVCAPSHVLADKEAVTLEQLEGRRLRGVRPRSSDPPRDRPASAATLAWIA
jgi:DNA-binding transcriptional LysR family regulator